MANIKPTTPIDIDERLKELDLYKYHPTMVVDTSLSRLSDYFEGRIKIVEPSNPLIYVLEHSALIGTLAIAETVLATRKLYPILSNNEEDLYRHMSDKEYLNRFSSPAYAKVHFHILLNDFITKGYKDFATKDTIFTIPNNMKVMIEGYIFTTTAPIIIRRTESGVIDVRYSSENLDDVFPISTNHIDFWSSSVNQEEKYISFEIPLPEIDLEAKNIVVELSKLVKGKFVYKENRLFYYCKVWYITRLGEWREMLVTHTDEVWDINTPTCLIKVLPESNSIDYYIPPIYTETGMISGTIKMIIYTTRGPININFSDYPISSFSTEYNGVFKEKDLNEHSTIFNIIAKRIFIRDNVIGGGSGKTFANLKADVVNNNLRPHLPITANQINNYSRDEGIEPIRNHDVVTSREFLVKAKIPSSLSRYKVTKIRLNLMEFKTSYADLSSGKNSVIKKNKDIVVIPQGTLFKIDDITGVHILTTSEAINLKGLTGQPLAKELNNNEYMSLYYHYIIDTSDETVELRAYELDSPMVLRSNFKDYNESTKIGINTHTPNIIKTDTGYRLDFLVSLRIFDNSYDIYNVTPYIVFKDNNGNNYFLEGKLFSTLASGNIFTFYIDTDSYLDKKDKIHVTNFKDHNGDVITISLDIVQELNLIYVTNNFPVTFSPKEADKLISGSYLAGHKAVITLETHTVKFGDRLKYLYTRVHTSTGSDKYQLHTTQVFKRYESMVYNSSNVIVHRVGDFVLDGDGDKIIEYDVGDVVIGDDGFPIVDNQDDLARYLNVLLLDYRAEVANSTLTKEYKYHIKKTMNTLIVNNLTKMQEELLERTKSFLTVPNGFTNLEVEYDGKLGYIKPNQSFKFNIYVKKRVYYDDVLKTGIENTIKETLDIHLSSNNKLSKVVLLKTIHNKIEEYVKSISLHKFTELDAEYVELLSDNAEVSINKVLVVTPDGYDIREDIAFNFINISDK